MKQQKPKAKAKPKNIASERQAKPAEKQKKKPNITPKKANMSAKAKPGQGARKKLSHSAKAKKQGKTVTKTAVTQANDKSGAGRPKAFNSVDELKTGISDYFVTARREKKALLMIGLYLHLGISRDTGNLYLKGEYDEPDDPIKGIYPEKYSDTLKKAKMQIEEDKWTRGLSGEYNTAVVIFDLKNNHDCTDKIQTTDTTRKPINFDDLQGVSPEEAQIMFNELLRNTSQN